MYVDVDDLLQQEMPRRSHTPEQQSALCKRQVGPEQQELQSAQAATQARAFQCSR